MGHLETPHEEFARLNREYEEDIARAPVPNLDVPAGCLTLVATVAVAAVAVFFVLAGLLGG